MPKKTFVPKKDQEARWTPLMQALGSSAENALYAQDRADGWPLNYADALTNENCDGVYAFVLIEMVEAGLEASTPEAIKAEALKRIAAIQLDLAVIANAVSQCDVEGLDPDGIRFRTTGAGKPVCPYCHRALHAITAQAVTDENAEANYVSGTEYEVPDGPDTGGGSIEYKGFGCPYCGKDLPTSYQQRLSASSG